MTMKTHSSALYAEIRIEGQISTRGREGNRLKALTLLGPKGLQHYDFAQVLCAQNLSLVVCMPRDTNTNTVKRDT